MMWVGLSHQLEALGVKTERNSALDCNRDPAGSQHWPTPDLTLARPHHLGSQFLKINQCVYVCARPVCLSLESPGWCPGGWT